jgi:hypothetical protein
MPKGSSPIRASPDSFNKIRLWAGLASDMDVFPSTYDEMTGGFAAPMTK